MNLGDRIVRGDSEAVLGAFLGWVQERGLTLYPAQEEAILEIIAGRHVILNTPTGSGKSLVAVAMHFKALCEDRRAFYTAPIKALVSEKFFELCDIFGAERVGMLTGDASINPQAPLICCTAEILANMALQDGRYTRADYVVMDEFHFYADRERGVAWQVPLLELCDATFLLMSATLGDVRSFVEQLSRDTGKGTAVIRSKDRPVPLDFRYLELSVHRVVQDLVREGRSPVYLVNFTQREAAEQAQSLTSQELTSKETRQALREALAHFRFDTPYGRTMHRLLQQGVGIHHAGLLPKYRRLVEKIAQSGHLKVISGTDTLGVGVNIPIRTVLFTRLYKFDGQASRLLSARDFHQIAGRAGRKGFDERGSVICLAPEHVVENQTLDASKKKKKKPLKRAPEGYVPYSATTFAQLRERDPEPLASTFQVTPPILSNVLSREALLGHPDGGYRRLVQLIARSYERSGQQKRHRRHAATLFRALRSAGIITTVRLQGRPHVRFDDSLQRDFSLFHTLSLFLVDALARLEPDTPDYALHLVSCCEAILESPRLILLKQTDVLKQQRLAELKAEGVPYEERIAELDTITHPKPLADFLYAAFNAFRARHSWVQDDNVRPKSIARDMIERYASFNDYVKDYDLERAEGVLLRYLSQCYKVLVQNVPETYKNEAVYDAIGYLRAVLGQVDASLVSEWETLAGGKVTQIAAAAEKAPDPLANPRTFRARVRAELHHLVRCLATRNYDEAALALRQDPDAPEWSPERLAQAIAPFYMTYPELIFDHRARLSEHTQLRELEPRLWLVQQTLVDPAGDNLWGIEATIDLRTPLDEGPLLTLVRIGD